MGELLEAQRLVDEYLAELRDKSYEGRPSDYETGRAILAAAPDVRAAIAILVVSALRQITDATWNGAPSDLQAGPQLKDLARHVLRADLPFTAEDLIVLLQQAAASTGIHTELPWGSLLGAVERHAENHGVSDSLRTALFAARATLWRAQYYEARRLVDRINVILLPTSMTRPEILAGEAWSSAATRDLDGSPRRDAWNALLAHTASGSRPSGRWLKRAGELVAAIGGDFEGCIARWFPLLAERAPGTSPPPDPEGGDAGLLIEPANAEILKTLAWACAAAPSDTLARALGDAADACFTKLPGHGPRNVKVGNACVAALSIMPVAAAVAQLSHLKAHVRHPSSLAQIRKALRRAAGRAGVAPDEPEEMGTR